MPASSADIVQPAEETVGESATNQSVQSASAADPKKIQLLKDRAAKIYKQHMEIVKLKDELKHAIEEKQSIEEEIKARNDEFYKMNERMIFLEFQKQ